MSMKFGSSMHAREVTLDEVWWDERTLVDGKVVLSPDQLLGHGDFIEARLHWVRWRLIDELLQRFYVDYGLEPGFGYLGVELYNIALWSPHCRRDPRYFGRLCPHGGFHPEDDTDLVNGAAPRVTYAALRSELPSEHSEERWASWRDYVKGSIAWLGLDHGGVVGHEGSFHRRGKSLLPTMYRVALLLRNAGSPWEAVSPHDGRSIYSFPPSGMDAHLVRDVERLLAVSDHDSDPPTASYFVVSHEGHPVAAIRTDGAVATRAGNVDAGALWRRGFSEREIAKNVIERIA